ncbi:hypothetical protein CHCC20348_3108 [Bacillus paralicheniformis]|nr:hypothetical protein CHCC20348_3108 [Bacillus paralicheniformis]
MIFQRGGPAIFFVPQVSIVENFKEVMPHYFKEERYET